MTATTTTTGTGTGTATLIESGRDFARPEARRVGTPAAARDEILRVAAIDAAFSTMTPAQAALLDRRAADMIATDIEYDVQTARLHTYAAM